MNVHLLICFVAVMAYSGLEAGLSVGSIIDNVMDVFVKNLRDKRAIP